MDNQVKVSKSKLTQQVQEGMKKKELAEFYGISQVQMGRLLKEAGLTIRKFHSNRPLLVDDTEDTQEEEYKDEPEVLVDNTPVSKKQDKVEPKEEVQEEVAQQEENLEEQEAEEDSEKEVETKTFADEVKEDDGENSFWS